MKMHPFYTTAYRPYLAFFHPPSPPLFHFIVTVRVISAEVEAQMEWNQFVVCNDEVAVTVWWVRLEI